MAASEAQPSQPQGTISLRLMPAPADTNHLGNIFGGWVMSQMDIAGALHVTNLTNQRVVTVAVESMKFHKPVQVGDEVTCYTHTGHVGRTSMAVVVETWVRKQYAKGPLQHVTSGTFIYVAIDAAGKPTPIVVS
jgi:acyl-CoA thioesterase YciA